MLVRRRVRGVWEPLVVEVVDQPGKAPSFDIFAEMFGIRPHGRFHGEHVLSQRLALRVLVHQCERVSSTRESGVRHTGQYTGRRTIASMGPVRPLDPALLRSFGGGLLVRVVRVRQRDDRSHDAKEHDRANEKSEERGLRVASEGVRGLIVLLVVCHRKRRGMSAAHATRTEFMTSLRSIDFMTSIPRVILPNTVCTPLRWRVLLSLSTMKNWLPPVSLPACAIDSEPTRACAGCRPFRT